MVYWHHRTKTSLFHRGFDHTLAFIHADGSYPSDESLLSNEVVSVSLTCTNRELPSQIRSGDITGTTGKNAAVASFRNITRPTQPLWPVIDGSLHWSLLSAMNLNYLSLLDTDALKQVIANFDRHAIHHPQTARLSQQKLDAIERLETRPVDRLFTGIPVRDWPPRCICTRSRLSVKGKCICSVRCFRIFCRCTPALTHSTC